MLSVVYVEPFDLFGRRIVAGELAAAQQKWERSLDKSQPLYWAPKDNMDAVYPHAQNGVFDGKRLVDGGDVRR